MAEAPNAVASRSLDQGSGSWGGRQQFCPWHECLSTTEECFCRSHSGDADRRKSNVEGSDDRWHGTLHVKSAEQIGLFPQGESRGSILLAGMLILRKQTVGLKRGPLRYADCTWMCRVSRWFSRRAPWGEGGLAGAESRCGGDAWGGEAELLGDEDVLVVSGARVAMVGVRNEPMVVLRLTVISPLVRSGVAGRQ